MTMMNSGGTRGRFMARSLVLGGLLASGAVYAEQATIVFGGEGRHCGEDPHCINRLHPDIPMAGAAAPGEVLLLRTRNALDFPVVPSGDDGDGREIGAELGTVHPLTGPVHIEGARRGDVLAVTLLDIAPGPFGWTSASSFGFASDLIGEDAHIVWRLDAQYAVADDLPGIRIPNGSFPGIVTTLPGQAELETMLAREQAVAEAGGNAFLPDPTHAYPDVLCGPEGSARDDCLRTLPPREHGGNLDIRYLRPGVTVYLPCYVAGCGLAVGDLHYAQGDGEISGTAIEMDADVTLVTRIVRKEEGAPSLGRGPHYEGPAHVLDIPSRRFYAVTGFPLKEAGSMPPDMDYLESPVVAGLANLNKDLNLAARNAVGEIVDYISERFGYTRVEAYMIASVAVDLRIGQLVDAPNVGVTALLPLDIFVDAER